MNFNKKYIAILGLFLFFLITTVFYFYKTPVSLVKIPITFSSGNIPQIPTEIEGKIYYLEFSTASKFPLHLNKNILNSIVNKTPSQTVNWVDAKGISYETNSYLIPSIKIGDLVLKDVVAIEDDEYIGSNSTTILIDGSLGRPILEKTNLMFDFPNMIMVATNDKEKLEKENLIPPDMVCVPFEIGWKDMIILPVETDLNKLKMILVTGSTYTFMNSSLLKNFNYEIDKFGLKVMEVQNFMMGGHNFGSSEVSPFDSVGLKEIKEVDGFLGMDFLMPSIIYIDYPNRKIYLNKT